MGNWKNLAVKDTSSLQRVGHIQEDGAVEIWKQRFRTVWQPTLKKQRPTKRFWLYQVKGVGNPQEGQNITNWRYTAPMQKQRHTGLFTSGGRWLIILKRMYGNFWKGITSIHTLVIESVGTGAVVPCASFPHQDCLQGSKNCSLMNLLN